MSSQDRHVECAEHGPRPATFLCQHLPDGRGLGFYLGLDPDDPDDCWPDAWCKACEDVREAESDWTERAEAFAGVRVLCDLCYERVRENNWVQDDNAYRQLAEEATAYLDTTQEALKQEFRIGEYPRYDWDQEAAQLVFSHDGTPRVIADIQFVGSISTHTHTWLWSWANTAFLKPVSVRMREVREYGEDQGFLKLACAHWSADEANGWEMTAIAAYLLKAVGAYRTPSERGFTFMVMTRVRWA